MRLDVGCHLDPVPGVNVLLAIGYADVGAFPVARRQWRGGADGVSLPLPFERAVGGRGRVNVSESGSCAIGDDVPVRVVELPAGADVEGRFLRIGDDCRAAGNRNRCAGGKADMESVCRRRRADLLGCGVHYQRAGVLEPLLVQIVVDLVGLGVSQGTRVDDDLLQPLATEIDGAVLSEATCGDVARRAQVDEVEALRQRVVDGAYDAVNLFQPVLDVRVGILAVKELLLVAVEVVDAAVAEEERMGGAGIVAEDQEHLADGRQLRRPGQAAGRVAGRRAVAAGLRAEVYIRQPVVRDEPWPAAGA